MKSTRKKTPVRNSLRKNSPLFEDVQYSIGAVKKSHRKMLSTDIRDAFGDSIDLDAALREGHAEENRWDYLLGHTPSREIIGVEPHSAKTQEIESIIRKKKAAIQQLAPHLKTGKRISEWIWVASGKNHFADTEKARRIIDQNGIQFVGAKVLPKHLPAARSTRTKRKR